MPPSPRLHSGLFSTAIQCQLSRMILFAFALAAPLAPAQSGTDYPHRDWGQTATLDMSLGDATTCVTQGIARTFERVIPVPAESGSDIDAGPGGGIFGVAHDPWIRLKVRQEGTTVTLRAFYRHPLSQKRVGKLIDKMQKRCLRIRSLD